MTQVIKYKCDWCNFQSEFLDQEIWEINVPMGYSMYEDERPKSLTVYKQHVCLRHGVGMYKDLMKIKEVEGNL